jgi:hypothetical protein
VISANKDLSQLAGTGNYFVGVSAISHHVAKVPDHVEGRKALGASVERMDIRMNVADY